MKRHTGARRAATLFVLFSLLLGLAMPVCSAAAEAATSPSYWSDPWKPFRELARLIAVKTDLLLLEVNKTVIRAYLAGHTEEMEALAETMLLAGPEDSLTYKPMSGKLLWHDQKDFWTYGEITEHPILEAAAFMKDCRCFGHAQACFDYYLIDLDCCVFDTLVYDASGQVICLLKLLYCTEPVTEKEYFPLEELQPNWYLYIQWAE